MRLLIMLIPFAVVAVVSACAPEPRPDAARTYQRHCVACHGQSGTGNGPLAGDLPLAPADLTRISARNDGVFPTGAVMATIYGYRGREFEGLMPAFGPVLEDGPKVIWRAPDGAEVVTPAALLALADYIEGLQVP